MSCWWGGMMSRTRSSPENTIFSSGKKEWLEWGLGS